MPVHPLWRLAGRLDPSGFILPALALYGLFVLWPLGQVGWLSLQHWNGYGPQTFIGLNNFTDLWGDAVFRTSLTHSVLWEFATVLVTALGLGIALIARHSRLRSLALAALFFPVLLPATVVAAIWTLVYSPLHGLLNTSLRALGASGLARAWLGDPSLALPALFIAWLWASLGIGTLVFWAGLATIGREYLELAVVEGAGPIWRFRHVIAPALRRTVVIALLVNVALAAEVFDLVFVTTGGGPGYATMVLPIDMYGRAFGGATGQGAAVAAIQVLVGLALAAAALLLFRGGGETMTGHESVVVSIRSYRRDLSTFALALVLIAVLIPLGWLAVVALGGGGFGVGASSVGFDPRTWEWSSFSLAWNTGMNGALATSALLAAGSIGLTLLLSAPAAFALSRLRRPWMRTALALLLLGFFQPTPVLIIPLFTLVKGLGLLDTTWGVLLPEVARNLPFACLLLWAFIAQLPNEIMESAAVDGASPFRQMLSLALPLSRPALAAVAVWAFVTSWNEYLLPTLVSQDGSLQTVPTLLATFIGRFNTQYDLLGAGSLISIAPALLIYAVLHQSASVAVLRAEKKAR